MAPSHDEVLEELEERRALLERLSRITSSISHRQPLQAVLDAITEGAAELLSDEVVGLRLIDPHDPDFVIVVSHIGLEDSALDAIQRTPATEGAGGRALIEGRLVVIEDYASSELGLAYFREKQLEAAMAAPVREGSEVIGSLAVATYRPERRYSDSEKDALVALANHASLALSDAKMVEEMREAQRSKDMFLAMMSHELKTPLTVIMGTLGMLDRHLGELEPAAQREMLRSALERGADLQRMIDQILEGARAELSDEPQEVELKDLLVSCLSGFENTFRIQTGDVQEALCRVHAESVRRIIGILLENAIGHSPTGTPIEVSSDVDGDAVTLFVRNQGELPEDREQLFEPFSRGEESTPGVGLGLYITAQLALSIGGELDLDAGSGSVVARLTLPGSVSSTTRV